MGFEEVEAVTPMDYLRRAGIEVILAGVSGEYITGAHGITLKTDLDVAGTEDLELNAVVLPGGMPGAENIAASGDALRLILRVFHAGGLIAAICAAPAVVLDPLGVLKNKQATCYPGFEKRFMDAAYVQDRVVLDGNVITSCGPGCAADFSFAIIDYLAGGKQADEVRQRTLHH